MIEEKWRLNIMAIPKGTGFNYEVYYKPQNQIINRVVSRLGLIIVSNQGETNVNRGISSAWYERGWGRVNIGTYHDTNQIAAAIASAVASIGYPAFSVKVWF